MLRMRGDGSEGTNGESPRLPEMRTCHYGDVNPARNILEQARVEAEPLLVQRSRMSKFGR